MKKIKILWMALLSPILLWGQQPNNIEEHGPTAEFARESRLERLTQTTRWDAAAFPEESTAPTGFAAYLPFTTNELLAATAPWQNGPHEGTPLTLATVYPLAEVAGTYTGSAGPVPARLKTVQEEAYFVFAEGGTFRLLRTNYLFLDAEGRLLDALAETVWQDTRTRMHNYYINRMLPAQSAEFTAKVYPNPTGSHITLEVAPPTPGTCAVTLLDGAGLALRPLATVRPVTGAYRQTFDVSTLPAGRYYLLLHTDAQNLTLPFVKQ